MKTKRPDLPSDLLEEVNQFVNDKDYKTQVVYEDDGFKVFVSFPNRCRCSFESLYEVLGRETETGAPNRFDYTEYETTGGEIELDGVVYDDAIEFEHIDW